MGSFTSSNIEKIILLIKPEKGFIVSAIPFINFSKSCQFWFILWDLSSSVTYFLVRPHLFKHLWYYSDSNGITLSPFTSRWSGICQCPDSSSLTGSIGIDGMLQHQVNWHTRKLFWRPLYSKETISKIFINLRGCVLQLQQIIVINHQPLCIIVVVESEDRLWIYSSRSPILILWMNWWYSWTISTYATKPVLFFHNFHF